MDVFTRMIRGWQVSHYLNTSLTLKPLEQAGHQSVPEIHHSDQGVQSLSTAYISIFNRHGIEISLAKRGCPWENGYAERLIRTLKEEEVDLNDYEDITQASGVSTLKLRFVSVVGNRSSLLQRGCSVGAISESRQNH